MAPGPNGKVLPRRHRAAHPGSASRYIKKAFTLSKQVHVIFLNIILLVARGF